MKSTQAPYRGRRPRRSWIPDSFIAYSTRLMRRLRFQQKLLCVSVVFLLPVVVTLSLLLRSLSTDIDFTRQELRGVGALRPTISLIATLQRHRAVTCALIAGGHRNAADTEKLALEASVADDMGRITQWSATEGARLNLAKNVRALESDWDALRSDNQRPVADEFNAHSELISHLITFLQAVADRSNLTLDPSMATYALMDLITNRGPGATESLERLRSLGQIMLVPDSALSPGAFGRLMAIQGSADEDFGSLPDALRRAFDVDPETGSRLAPALDRAVQEHAAFTRLASSKVFDSDTVQISGSDFYAAGAEASARLLALNQNAIPELDRLLSTRLSETSRWRLLVILTCLGSLVLAVYLFLGFERSLSESLSALHDATAQLARAEFPDSINLRSSDELQDIGNELETVSHVLKGSTDALHRTLALQSAILDSASVSIIAMDPNGGIVSFNRAAQRMLGYSEQEALGQSMVALLHDRGELDAHASQLTEEMKELVEGGFESLVAEAWLQDSVAEHEWTYIRKDGSRFPVLVAVTAIRNAEGAVIGFLAVGHDISERKQKDLMIVRSLREKETLLKEVYHRVKNNLQVVTSLFDMQLARLPEGQAHNALRDAADRVGAMALVHEKLYQSGNLSSISLKTYIEDLCERLGTASNIRGRGIAITTSVEPVEVEMDTAVPLGLLLNEVIINSLKHAFPNGRKGEIRITLDHTPDHRLRLMIADDGVGYPDTGPRRPKSLGMKLVASLSAQLDGEYSLESKNGACMQLIFPLPGSPAPEQRSAA